MAARILTEVDQLSQHHTTAGKTVPILHEIIGGTEEQATDAIALGVVAAHRFYKSAQLFLAAQGSKTIPLPAFFSPEEIESNYVPYARACVLATGEPKPNRAVKKWDEYTDLLVKTALAEGLCPTYPAPFQEPDESWTPRGILLAMEEYEKFQKKPIDLTKRQYAPHPGHGPKPKRQRRKRRGPRLPKLGQI